MKTAVVVSLPARPGAPMSGPRRVCVHLAQSLQRLNPEGVQIYAYGETGDSTGSKAIGRERALRHCELEVRHVGYLRLYSALKRFDAVYFAGGPFPALHPLLARGTGRRPAIAYCAHGIIRNERKLHAAEETRAAAWREWVEGIVLRRCDLIVCASPVSAEMATREWGVPSSKIALVPHGVSRDFLTGGGGSVPKADRPRIVTIAQVHRYKGLEFLIRSLGRIRELDFELEIISTGGSASYRRHLETTAAADDVGLAGRVSFAGPLGREELKQRLSAGAVYVQSSEQETFCLAVLEAMAAGLPVIVTRSTGVSYLLRHEVNGFVIDYGDEDSLSAGVKKLLQDATLRRAIAERNRSRAVELDWDNSARVLLGHLSGLCGSARNAA